MNEFVRSLRHFIARDVIYIVGGGTVLLSFLYLFDKIPEKDISTPYFLFVAGIAYVVGYAVQDGGSLIGLTTTSYSYRPGRFTCFWFETLQRRPFPKIPKEFNFHKKVQELYDIKNNEEFLSSFRRIINLLQVGATMGPSSLLSGGILGFKAYETKTYFDFSLSAGAIIFGFLFIVHSWIKVAQRAEAIYDFLLPSQKKSKKVKKK